MARSLYFVTWLALACVSGCAAPDPPETGAAEALVAGIDSGAIAVAACPCTDLAAATAADGHVEVFARSAADGGLWRIWETGAGGLYAATNAQRLTQPKHWTYASGKFVFVPAETTVGAPTVVLSHADQQLHVFYERRPDQIMHVSGAGLGVWSLVPQPFQPGFHGPSAIEVNGTLRLFADGDDGLVYLSELPAGGIWSPWAIAGTWMSSASVSGPVSVVSTPDQVTWLVARDGYGATWVANDYGDAFGSWTSLGGYLQFPATAGVDASGLVNLAGVGGDGRIWLALEQEQDWGFDPWQPIIDGAVGGSAGAANSAPHFGVNNDGRLELFFNNSGGAMWSVAQCGPGTWDGRQPSVTGAGASWWSGADVAVATEGDGRLVGFHLDGAGQLAYARALLPSVRMPGGWLVGRSQCSAQVFKGVPFAVPPTGGLRFHAPVPAPTDVVVDAGRYQPMCPQLAVNPGAQSEDCLYLNVFAPSHLAAPAPVMVFLHGGGNKNGDAADYDATAMVNRAQALGTPVLVVTVAYRLNALGYLAYPGISNGNNALADQRLALEWVQQHIARFGGDPARVTLFGQSGGAADVQRLASSPSTTGLFWAAIMESGFGRTTLPTLAQAQQAGAAIADRLMTNMHADPLAPSCASPEQCLMVARPDELMTAQRDLIAVPDADPYTTRAYATIDGVIVTDQPMAALTTYLRVPIIAGSNRDETALSDKIWIPETADAYVASVNGYGPDAAKVVLERYPPQPDSKPTLVSLDSDEGSLCTTRAATRAAATTVPVYRYLFAHVSEDASSPTPGGTVAGLGAFHGAELSYVFSTMGQVFQSSYRPTAAELALSDTLLGYWTRFAATRDPNGGGAPVWPRYLASTGTDPVLWIADVITASPGYHVAECDFFDTIDE